MFFFCLLMTLFHLFLSLQTFRYDFEEDLLHRRRIRRRTDGQHHRREVPGCDGDRGGSEPGPDRRLELQQTAHIRGASRVIIVIYTLEPLLRGHPDESSPPLERPLDNVNLNINVLIFTLDERPSLLKGHFSDAKGVTSQEGFHCI